MRPSSSTKNSQSVLQPIERIPLEKDYYRIYSKSDPEELRRRLVPEIFQEFPERGLRLYGARLPRCDHALVKSIEALTVRKLVGGQNFTANGRHFRVEKPLGVRSYRIADVATKQKYYLKIEALGLPRQGPSLKRDILVLNNAHESSSNNRRHFLSIFDRGSFPHLYNFVILQLCDCSLSDIRPERLNGAEFSRSTALNIASQTLQGIHDVQLHHYMHRDIRPGNFVVGLNENHHVIYIVNFSLAYEYVARNARLDEGKKPAVNETPRATPKLPWISCRFQSRAFHLGQPIRRLDDVEAWVYLLMEIFDSTMLPWKKAKTERIGYEQKERLFAGDYQDQLGDLKPYLSIMMNYLESARTKQTAVVDYPFFGTILDQMGKDWKLTGKEPLDWAPDPCGYRNQSRSAERVKKSKESRTNVSISKKKSSPLLSPSRDTAPVEEDFNFLPVILPESSNVKRDSKEKVPPRDDEPKKEKTRKKETETNNNNDEHTPEAAEKNNAQNKIPTKVATRPKASPSAKKSQDDSEAVKKKDNKDDESEKLKKKNSSNKSKEDPSDSSV